MERKGFKNGCLHGRKDKHAASDLSLYRQLRGAVHDGDADPYQRKHLSNQRTYYRLYF